MIGNPLHELRKAYLEKLKTLPYPVYLEADVPDGKVDHYIILTGQTATEVANKSKWIGSSTFSLDVITNSMKGGTTTLSDQIADQAARLVSDGEISPAGYQASTLILDGVRQLTETTVQSKIFRTIITFSHKVKSY